MSKLGLYAVMKVLTLDSYLIERFTFPELSLQLTKDLAVLATILLLVFDELHAGVAGVLQLNVLVEHDLAVHGVVPLSLFPEGKYRAGLFAPDIDRVAIEAFIWGVIDKALWTFDRLFVQVARFSLCKLAR